MTVSATRLVPRNFRAIVFDWDGTLADSTAIIAASLQRACADLNIPVPDDRAARHVIGLGLADALRHVAPGLAVDRHSDLAVRYRMHFLERDPGIPLFDGIPDLLRDLRAAGYRLAIATGKTRRGLDRALQQQRIEDMFECTRCADESEPKPHPEMLECVMARLGVMAVQTLMVGDTTHDIRMARSAGVAALAVSYGAHAADDLVRLDGVPLVHSVPQLRQWLSTNG